MTEAAQGLLQVLRDAPPVRARQGRYELRFARTQEELDEILHLRFNVFNVELGEGLETSFLTRRDEDSFDRACHHLLVEDLASGRIVGTYRMQTWEMAQGASGFYSAGEFTLETLPPDVLTDAVEIGRACIVREHRHRQVLFLLWKGLAGLRHALREALPVRLLLAVDAGSECRPRAPSPTRGRREAPSRASRRPARRLRVRRATRCRGGAPVGPVDVPQLFATYLRYGALVCGPPAIDREFKTIDYFVLLDTNALDPRTFRSFFAADGGESTR